MPVWNQQMHVASSSCIACCFQLLPLELLGNACKFCFHQLGHVLHHRVNGTAIFAIWLH